MLTQRLCKSILQFSGWSLDDQCLPKHCVLIVYPHTSNWDFILAMLGKGALGLQFHWLGKKELFRWPSRWLMEKLGGIPVDRKNPAGLIDSLVALYREQDSMVVALAPEGTRSFRPQWKSGFYRLALAAEVPITMAYIDYRHKRLGIGPSIEPSGQQGEDLGAIRAFYQTIHPLYPEKAAPVELASND